MKAGNTAAAANDTTSVGDNNQNTISEKRKEKFIICSKSCNKLSYFVIENTKKTTQKSSNVFVHCIPKKWEKQLVEKLICRVCCVECYMQSAITGKGNRFCENTQHNIDFFFFWNTQLTNTTSCPIKMNTNKDLGKSEGEKYECLVRM